MSHQGDGELARQQFVEREPGSRRMQGRQIGFLGGHMGARQRRFPVGPTVPGQVCGVLPLRQGRCALHARGDRLLDRPLRKPRGEAIERLHPKDGLALVERHHMVGMGDLDLGLVDVDLAADDADFAHRQQLLEIVLATVEVGQAKPAGLVAAPHPIGLAWIAGHQVLFDGDGERGDLAGARSGHFGSVAAIDEAGRQVPEQIDDQRPGEFLHELAKSRPDSG